MAFFWLLLLIFFFFDTLSPHFAEGKNSDLVLFGCKFILINLLISPLISSLLALHCVWGQFLSLRHPG